MTLKVVKATVLMVRSFNENWPTKISTMTIKWKLSDKASQWNLQLVSTVPICINETFNWYPLFLYVILEINFFPRKLWLHNKRLSEANISIETFNWYPLFLVVEIKFFPGSCDGTINAYLPDSGANISNVGMRYLWEGRRQLLERYLPDLHRNGVIQFPRLKSQATKGRNGFERKNWIAKEITNITGQISSVWYRRTRPGVFPYLNSSRIWWRPAISLPHSSHFPRSEETCWQNFPTNPKLEYTATSSSP